MNEELIEYLRNCLAVGLLVWFNDGRGFQLLKEIRRKEIIVDGGEELPAYYGAIGLGHYVDLYNFGLDFNDFWVTSPRLIRKESNEVSQRRTIGDEE